MFCSNCGENIDPQAQVCPRCGAASTTATQPTPPSAVATPPSLPSLSPPSEARFAAPQSPSEQPQTDGKAVFSLVLGILSVTCLWILAGIPAIILGHMSVSSIRKSMGRLKGEGMATAGFIMGYISIAALPMVLIIAAIAIPNLLKARISANNAAASATVRTLITAESTYSITYPTQGVANLPTLGGGTTGDCSSPDARHACIIDTKLGCASESWCTKDAFRYNITLGSTDYVITAAPIPGQGDKSYCATGDGVVRYKLGTVDEPVTQSECQSWEPQ
jgi:type IV pilus assembly protein PilA